MIIQGLEKIDFWSLILCLKVEFPICIKQMVMTLERMQILVNLDKRNADKDFNKEQP